MRTPVVRKLGLALAGALACCVVGAVALAALAVLAVLAVMAAVAVTLLALGRAAPAVSFLLLAPMGLRRRIATPSGAPASAQAPRHRR